MDPNQRGVYENEYETHHHRISLLRFRSSINGRSKPCLPLASPSSPPHPALSVCYLSPNRQAPLSQVSDSLKKGFNRCVEQAKDLIQRSIGIEVAVFSADVRDFDSLKKAVAEAGPFDVLVVNQGVFVPQELDKQKLDEIKFMIYGIEFG